MNLPWKPVFSCNEARVKRGQKEELLLLPVQTVEFLHIFHQVKIAANFCPWKDFYNC